MRFFWDVLRDVPEPILGLYVLILVWAALFFAGMRKPIERRPAMLQFAGRLFVAGFIAAGSSILIFWVDGKPYRAMGFAVILFTVLGVLILKLSPPANPPSQE